MRFAGGIFSQPTFEDQEERSVLLDYFPELRVGVAPRKLNVANKTTQTEGSRLTQEEG
jgi:hypothetical protein